MSTPQKSFVPRTRQIDYLNVATVGATLNVNAVELSIADTPWALSPDDARWIAAALTQAADYVDREDPR